MPRMKGKQAVMEQLRAEGVQYVFGNPGTTESPLLDALQDYPDMTYINTIYEGVAVGAADGYARATGKPAFVNVHISVGVDNTLSMLYNAKKGGTPLVVTAGQVEHSMMNHDAVLWTDMVDTVKGHTKYAVELRSVEDIPTVMRRAFREAKTPPSGPVFVSMPWELMEQEVEARIVPSADDYFRIRPDIQAVERAAQLLASAQNPIILLGDRVAQSGAAKEVVRLAEQTGARVIATGYSEVNFPSSHPQFLGSHYMSWPSLAIKRLLDSADVALVIGAEVFAHIVRLPEPLLGPHTKLIHMDSSAWEIGKLLPTAVGLWCDAKAGCHDLSAALDDRLSGTGREAARTRAAAIAQEKAQKKAAWQQRVKERWDHRPISVERMMAELAAAWPEDAILVDDSITSREALLNSVDTNRPGDYYAFRGGSLGWGMPGPLGVKLANPNRPVISVVGDGTAMYTIQSLWTARLYNLPVTWVICNNRSYRILKHSMVRYLAHFGDPKRESDFIGMSFNEHALDFVKLANGFGVNGIRVEDPSRLASAYRAAFNAGEPMVVDVLIDESFSAKKMTEEWRAWFTPQTTQS